ncbi:MAG: methylenetetrahydrofolate--tRNA-(uracil(54)-C(5))-methyltransferase (FADH(2)-oxidizing) TrmFO [Clostridia bacterium]|nr:methylenetetrahydrofolate--tRNA-(uracil(54)-C(5))-methyltransferase (FADH(2)-oxidizing) TrmFO [Clostridia bacterium]
MRVNIIGAGLAGCECANILARNNVDVTLIDMKPSKKSEAHIEDNFGELVCSNSLKSSNVTNACGLLKEEMKTFGSLMLEAAEKSKLDAGQALAVDRKIFSEYITEKIKSYSNITVVSKEVTDITEYINREDEITVVATGPLTTDGLTNSLRQYLDIENLYFYDAEAPIIDKESIDMEKAYFMDRYGKEGEGAYLNLSMTKDEYYAFYNALITAESANRHEFDKLMLFEGCMPIEEMAKRGEKTLTFGMLKPVGLVKEESKGKVYAVVQLRKEDEEAKAYNMVGFQTSLKFSEQERVFRMIPGLENAEFLRYGVMHRNTYINGGKLLNSNFSLKKNNNIYFAGQISGVEGYVESAMSGMIVALDIIARLNNRKVEFTTETMMGALSRYISTENENYQPMNANFGIIKGLDEKIKDKKEKYTRYAKRSLNEISRVREEMDYLR